MPCIPWYVRDEHFSSIFLMVEKCKMISLYPFKSIVCIFPCPFRLNFINYIYKLIRRCYASTHNKRPYEATGRTH